LNEGYIEVDIKKDL